MDVIRNAPNDNDFRQESGFRHLVQVEIPQPRWPLVPKVFADDGILRRQTGVGWFRMRLRRAKRETANAVTVSKVWLLPAHDE